MRLSFCGLLLGTAVLSAPAAYGQEQTSDTAEIDCADIPEFNCSILHDYLARWNSIFGDLVRLDGVSVITELENREEITGLLFEEFLDPVTGGTVLVPGPEGQVLRVAVLGEQIANGAAGDLLETLGRLGPQFERVAQLRWSHEGGSFTTHGFVSPEFPYFLDTMSANIVVESVPESEFDLEADVVDAYPCVDKVYEAFWGSVRTGEILVRLGSRLPGRADGQGSLTCEVDVLSLHHVFMRAVAEPEPVSYQQGSCQSLVRFGLVSPIASIGIVGSHVETRPQGLLSRTCTLPRPR